MSYIAMATTAVHEAGHAVIGWRNGIPVARVTVNPPECHWAGHGTPIAHAKAGLAGALAVMRLAGPNGSWNCQLSSADWGNVCSSQFTDAEWRALVSATQDEVRAQWPWIMPTAMALYLRNAVNAAELQSILDGPGDTSEPTWFERMYRGLTHRPEPAFTVTPEEP